MAAEGKKVTIHRDNVYLHVGCTLRTIDQNGDAVFVSYADDFLDRIHRSQHIADVGYADELCAR